MMFRRRRLDTACTVAVEHTNERFEAHVELDGEVEIRPGDRVRVHGEPIHVAFGHTLVVRRPATVERAGPIERALTRIKARFELAELYEVSFTPRRVL
jgi:hypothetical protein